MHGKSDNYYNSIINFNEEKNVTITNFVQIMYNMIPISHKS